MKKLLFVILIISFIGFVIIHALLPRVGPKLVSLAREINVVMTQILK